MPAHQKECAVTIVATAPVAACRFVAYAGQHATAAGGGADSQGISECDAAPGQALSAITEYSGLVEAAAPIAQFAFVKPALDGSGKAITGSATEHCGRALGAATAAGQLIEVQVLPHRHS